MSVRLRLITLLAILLIALFVTMAGLAILYPESFGGFRR